MFCQICNSSWKKPQDFLKVKSAKPLQRRYSRLKRKSPTSWTHCPKSWKTTVSRGQCLYENLPWDRDLWNAMRADCENTGGSWNGKNALQKNRRNLQISVNDLDRFSSRVNNSHAKISPLIENDNFDTKTQPQDVSALRDYIENPLQYKAVQGVRHIFMKYWCRARILHTFHLECINSLSRIWFHYQFGNLYHMHESRYMAHDSLFQLQ